MLSHCFLQEDHSWMLSSNSSFLLNFSLFFQQIMIMKKKDDFLLQNEEASVRYCQAELKKLSEPLATSISEGTFFVPGGHSLYLEARNKFEQDYKLVPRKGVKVRSNRIGKEQQIRVKGSLLVHLVARSWFAQRQLVMRRLTWNPRRVLSLVQFFWWVE